MTTGWKYIMYLDGRPVDEFKSKMGAAMAHLEYPGAMFAFSELSMAGEKLTDCTEEVKSWASKIRRYPGVGDPVDG